MSDTALEAIPSEGAVLRWRAPDVGKPGAQASSSLTAARLAEIEELAREDGYRRGLEEGRAAGEREVRATVERLERVLTAIRPQAEVLDQRLMEQLGALVMAIARALIRRELKRQPGEVVRVVREALAALPASEAPVRIYLNPDDAQLARRMLGADSPERSTRIFEDLSVSRGGARVETDSSVVDATVEARLSAIAAAVFGDERAPEGVAPGERDDGSGER